MSPARICLERKHFFIPFIGYELRKGKACRMRVLAALRRRIRFLLTTTQHGNDYSIYGGLKEAGCEAGVVQ